MTNQAMPAGKGVMLDDDIVAINDYLYENGFTDGLPVIPPTKERVAAMIKGSGRTHDELIGNVAPALGAATVEKIAISAVMAGCRPEYMPVLIAAVEAAVRPAFNLGVAQVTTHPAAPMLLLNGPIRKQLGIGCGTNAMGHGNRANATIGRAMRFILLNLGGAPPGKIDKSTQGMPARYTFCFGENEEESPFTPLHVDKGYRLEQSTVTVFSAGGFHHLANGDNDGKDVLKTLTYGSINGSTNTLTCPEGEPLILLCPAHARLLAQAGYTKKSMQEHFFEHSRVPAAWLSNYKIKRRKQGNYPVDMERGVPMTDSPDNYHFVVVGGEGGLHSTFIPSLGPTKMQTQAIQMPSK